MRCLYCGKELALLKRLTGGAEFCSDAHRKQYQDEFNSLALNRLMDAPPPAQAKPLLEPPPETPLPATPPPVSKKTVEKPQPKDADPVVGPLGYLIEPPLPGLAALAVAGAEPNFGPAIPTVFPKRRTVSQDLARAVELAMAEPLRSSQIPKAVNPRVQPHAGSIEIREFLGKAAAPAASLHQTLQAPQTVLPGRALGDAMEITTQPRPPLDSPLLWQAGPHPSVVVNLLLGDLARLDYPSTGFGEDTPQLPVVESAEPAATAPAPIEVAAAPESIHVPERATQPLPITLHGPGVGQAKLITTVSAGIVVSFEPKAPPSSAVPLRPTVVLADRPARPEPAAATVNVEPKPTAAKPSVAKPVTRPEPVAAVPVRPVAPSVVPPVVPTAATPPVAAPPPQAPTPVAAKVPESTVVRPVRGSANKQRRPEIRVVQTGAEAKPVAQAAPPPAPPAPERKPSIAPAANRAATLPPPEANTQDLHLPEIHNPEVQGAWAKMPMALKAGIGAALALAIVGFAYSTLNSSSATAKTTAVKLAPTYELGKQINSGGWIEDWAPNDKDRRITLLRGSQPYSDYRIEFDAQIQNKAIGWMYRGLNPKNYYVVKLEKLKPGIEPVVAVVRYAVIDGVNEKRTETILPLKVRVDTTYKVRFDAVGNEFALWVQGKKVDEWKDSRLGSGGLGLYAEGEEAAAIHGTVNVFELVSAK